MSGSQLLLLGGTPQQVVSDPNFEYTTLLLPGNGTNGAQNNTFLDSSTNNFTITRNGNTTQGTFSPFSQTGWGNYFDGTGDFLTVGSSGAFGLGTGDFTIEMWVYPTANPANGPGTIFDLRTSASATACASRIDSSLNLSFYNGPANTEFNVGTVQLNTWTHIAYVRASGSLKTYVNGTLSNTTAVSSDLGANQPCMIGNNQTAGYAWNGYQSNFRIVKGTAVYTSNFTPSTTPLTAISGTSLLTCQSNRFIDNSTNNFAITRNGDVSVQAFSPFNPTAAWSASTNGGSGYFDGSGDYLTTTTSSAFDLSSGDWTIQGWYYPTAYSAGNNVVAYVGTSAGDKIVIATIGTGGGLYYLLNGSVVITGGSAPLNAWSFFALVKSGGTTTLYINGVSQGTTTSVPTSSNKSLNLGSDAGAAPYQGYIADFRILKGTANTAVPTAPLTAITNTSLLTNFTNAGIYDATSKNDLETVGNAQISTTQSKFGGSSMYFDGTGDWLVSRATPDLELGSGDFTIEMWVYPSALTAGEALISKGNASSTGNEVWTLQWYPTNQLAFFSGAAGIGTPVVSTTTGFGTGTWYHVAVTKNSGTTRLFVNGVVAATSTASYTIATGGALYVGAGWFDPATRDINGYLQDVRITKGVARYTANFTPPTAAFPLL